MSDLLLDIQVKVAGQRRKCRGEGHVPWRPQGKRRLGARIQHVDGTFKIMGLDKIVRAANAAKAKGHNLCLRPHQPVSLGAYWPQAPGEVPSEHPFQGVFYQFLQKREQRFREVK